MNLKKRQWRYYNEFEETKEQRLKKSKQSLRNLWDTIKQTSTYIVRVPEGEERERCRENIWGEEKMAENFTNSMKEMNINMGQP